MLKQKKGVPQVKPYKNIPACSEQPNDNDIQKDSGHQTMSDGEQHLNGEDIIICCVCDGNTK